VKRVVPDFGGLSGGDDVLVEGSGFTPGTTVKLGYRAAKISSLRASALEVKTPPSTEAGAVDVVVTLPDGRTVVLKNGFRYQEARTLPLRRR